MNILLTGATGFLGSYFIKNYNKNYFINNFSFRKNNIEGITLHNIEIIVHLSALVHQMNGATKDEYERINVTQTLDLATKAKKSGVRHFIFMSTVKVYGEETENVYTENSECHPQDEYGKSKLKAEIELLKLEDSRFTISIIRTPIVYGHGVKANIKNLVQLVKKVSILPFGKIENKRSMVYIGNLCHLLNEVIKQRKSGVFLASDDKAVSTSNLIKLIAKSLEKRIYLIQIPLFETLLGLLKPSFHKRLYGSLEIDNTLTKKELNLKNPYTIEDGIRLMIQGE